MRNFESCADLDAASFHTGPCPPRTRDGPTVDGRPRRLFILSYSWRGVRAKSIKTWKASWKVCVYGLRLAHRAAIHVRAIGQNRYRRSGAARNADSEGGACTAPVFLYLPRGFVHEAVVFGMPLPAAAAATSASTSTVATAGVHPHPVLPRRGLFATQRMARGAVVGRLGPRLLMGSSSAARQAGNAVHAMPWHWQGKRFYEVS